MSDKTSLHGLHRLWHHAVDPLRAMTDRQGVEDAKELLLRAADLEPNNRSVREELVRAKKAVREEEKQLLGGA